MVKKFVTRKICGDCGLPYTSEHDQIRCAACIEKKMRRLLGDTAYENFKECGIPYARPIPKKKG